MPCCLLEHVDSNHTRTCPCWSSADCQTDVDMTQHYMNCCINAVLVFYLGCIEPPLDHSHLYYHLKINE